MTYPPICHENPNSSQAHLESIIYYHKQRLSHARGQQPLGNTFVHYGHDLFMGPLFMLRWHAIIGHTLSQSRAKNVSKVITLKLALNEYGTSLLVCLFDMLISSCGRAFWNNVQHMQRVHRIGSDFTNYIPNMKFIHMFVVTFCFQNRCAPLSSTRQFDLLWHWHGCDMLIKVFGCYAIPFSSSPTTTNCICIIKFV